MPPNNSRTKQRDRLNSRFREAPKLPLVSDQPIRGEDPTDDTLDLPLRIGPVYDILRHPETKTPLNVAIYGSWGTGKTSAMRWLEMRLTDWTKNSRASDKVTVHTAWFNPWRYHTREQVWKGLIAQVILACVKKEPETLNAHLQELANCGRWIFKSAGALISTLEVSLPGEVKAKVNLDRTSAKLKEVWDETFNPEAAYLDTFEHTFRRWAGNLIGDQKKNRLVVFIDDLDRCQPEVALQVLEALKLYLDIPGLVFVTGVDNEVVEQLIVQHYKGLGVGEDKARHYLAKMFQVEVPLARAESETGDFLRRLLEGNDYWQELRQQQGNARAMDVFALVIERIADRSPREIKRLVNSSLMQARGAELSDRTHDAESDSPKPWQTIQAYLLYQRLSHRSPRQDHLIGRYQGDSFFKAWSEIATEGTDPPDPTAIKDLIAVRDNPEQAGEDAWTGVFHTHRAGLVLYKTLIESHSRQFLDLLADGILAELMNACRYSPTAGRQAQHELADSGQSVDNQRIVDEAVAEIFSKQPEAVRPADRQRVTSLRIQGSRLSNLWPVTELPALTNLSVYLNDVSDLSPLAKLTALQTLNLAENTQVTDLGPLANLTELRALDISGTSVTDLSPLSGLTNLWHLTLDRTAVLDLSPLLSLPKLRTLSIRGCDSVDFKTIVKLGSLESVVFSAYQDRAVQPYRDILGKKLQITD